MYRIHTGTIAGTSSITEDNGYVDLPGSGSGTATVPVRAGQYMGQ